MKARRHEAEAAAAEGGEPAAAEAGAPVAAAPQAMRPPVSTSAPAAVTAAGGQKATLPGSAAQAGKPTPGSAAGLQPSQPPPGALAAVAAQGERRRATGCAAEAAVRLRADGTRAGTREAGEWGSCCPHEGGEWRDPGCTISRGCAWLLARSRRQAGGAQLCRAAPRSPALGLAALPTALTRMRARDIPPGARLNASLSQG